MVAFNLNMAEAPLEETPENIEKEVHILLRALIEHLPVQSHDPRNICDILNELNKKNVISETEFESIKRGLATSYNQ